MTDTRPFLVTGATGRQGGGTARALLAAGAPVRALVRDPFAPRARELEAAGAALVRGDLRDAESLAAACDGARGVFSVQTPLDGHMDYRSERKQGRLLVEAALSAGVAHFVQTSSSGAGEHHRNAPGFAEGRWSMSEYFESKAATEALVVAAGFDHWTLIKPPTFMDHVLFARSSISEGLLITAIDPATRLPLIAPADIGRCAAAAFLDPGRFDGIELHPAGDLLTVGEVTGILAEVWGEPVEPRFVTPTELVALGMPAPAVEAQEYFNEVGQPARPAQARELGLQLVDFRTWAQRTYV